MAALREIVIARITCPSCKKRVEVKAALATQAEDRIGMEYTLQIGLQGIWVNHDCRPKNEEAKGEERAS